MAEAEEITYEFLVNKWRKELRSPSLSKLEPNFWQMVEVHVRGIQEEYAREHAANPSSPKSMILQDELRNLQRARDDIYDLREKKIAYAALTAARGGNPGSTNMTRPEQDLYEELVRVLKEGRRNMLRRGARKPPAEAGAPGGGPPAPPEPVPADSAPRSAAPVPERAPEAGEASAPEQPLPGVAAPALEEVDAAPAPRTAEAVEAETPHQRRRAIVRVLEDVPPFLASDLRTYRLGAGDIASLPKDAAKALVTRGRARALEGEV